MSKSEPVWVVDDNSAVAESQVAMLTAEGIPARAFLGAMEVIAALRESQPSVMVLDVAMPDGGGNAVLEQILANPSWTFPVVVSTGCEDLVRKDLRGRAFKVVPKTIDPLQLAALVRRASGQVPNPDP